MSEHKLRVAQHFDDLAVMLRHRKARNRYYRGELERFCQLSIPPGSHVLEIGCGTGDLLASLRPSEGLGVDLSASMVEAARQRHPHLRFKVDSLAQRGVF